MRRHISQVGCGAELLNRTQEAAASTAADEAIHRLGLLNEKARAFLTAAVQDERGIHPRALSTAHRKNGVQLTRGELKGIGLRANAFMSRSAFAEITEKGMGEPLAAHENTLLRAYFSFARWRSLMRNQHAVASAGIHADAVAYHYDMLLPTCPTCSELHGTSVTPTAAHILPPESCACETANYMITMRIDPFYGLR